MRINQNIAALNAHRNLVATDNALSKSLERLSSGFRINRAADDAAGLAISEKMRAQVRGYTQAIRNAQDGISLVQTAEGALNEVHSILQRIRELVLQAGNETLSAEDRLAIQSEIDQLVEEVDRIANSTNFNGVLLLDGGAGGGPTSVNVVAGPSGGIAETITVSLADVRSSTLGDGTNSLQDVDVTDFS
ncbi:MAG: flagellin, partial [Armatimonadota bacterium]|nr:flagellin [Armatimonadota bacterium]